MAKGMYEKSIKVPAKPSKQQGKEPSFTLGAKQSKVSKPKSLTPSKNALSSKK